MKRYPTAFPVMLLLLFFCLVLVGFLPFSEEEPLPVRNYREIAEKSAPPLPVVERAARTIREVDGTTGMIRFLTEHLQRFPEDSTNGYYMTVVGSLYESENAAALARQYYRRALFSQPDIAVRSVPVHRIAINRLLTLSPEPDERLSYLLYLQQRYPEAIDRGLTAYHLGEAYEAQGLWKEAYESYRAFLRYPPTTVPGVPLAREDIARRLAFYDSTREWTYRDLNDLVTNIKNALWTQNVRALLSNRAGVNFFTMSWEQEINDANSEIPTFDIAVFLRRSRVRFADELDISSNANEAFLRTWGWSHRIPTWYIYFRRIDFPADPEIHGNWEWAGIYFGESM